MKHWPPELLDLLVHVLRNQTNLLLDLACSSCELAETIKYSGNLREVRLPVFLDEKKDTISAAAVFGCGLDVRHGGVWDTLFQHTTYPLVSYLTISQHAEINTLKPETFEQLVSLHIKGGKCVQADHIQCMSLLPCLKTLEIECQAKIWEDGLSLSTHGFLRLETLRLRTAQATCMKDMSCLKSLTHLEIGENMGFHSENVMYVSAALSNLTRLEIGGRNKVGIRGMEYLSKLDTLTHLVLGSYNEICSEAMQYVSRFSRLVHLEIDSFNLIGEIGAAHISNIQTLEHLQVGDYCKISPKGAKHISTLCKLKTLKLGDCNNLAEGFEFLSSGLKRLETLVVPGFNNIILKDMWNLAAFSTLKILDLGFRIHFSDDNLCQLATCATRLQDLRLQGRNIGNPAAYKHLAKMPCLHTLDVGRRNCLSFQAIKRIANISTLRHLAITKTMRFIRCRGELECLKTMTNLLSLIVVYENFVYDNDWVKVQQALQNALCGCRVEIVPCLFKDDSI